MARCPPSIAIPGWIFVATGCAGLGRAAFKLLDPASRAAAPPGADHHGDFAWAAASGLLALAGGAFTLRGRGWARWALAAWMAGHLVISGLHSAEQLAIHVAIFVPLSWALFRRRATEWFRGGRPGEGRA